MSELFLNANTLKSRPQDMIKKTILEYHTIEFGIPDGFAQIRFIEKLRLLENMQDEKMTKHEKFDFAYDITMQLLTGKTINVYWHTKDNKKELAFSFKITNRYMDLNDIPELNAYPVIIEWLVNFVVGEELKKYPLSLQNIQAVAREKK